MLIFFIRLLSIQVFKQRLSQLARHTQGRIYIYEIPTLSLSPPVRAFFSYNTYANPAALVFLSACVIAHLV